jgi:thiamine biosynthesis lipoprotein
VISSLSALVIGAMGMTTSMELREFRFTEVHMGGAVEIRLFAASQDQAESAARSAYQKIADLEQIMSDYRPSSEVRTKTSEATEREVRISRDLAVVLSRAQEVSLLSDGAFDVTAGPVVALWREARKTQVSPRWRDLSAALDLVDYKFVQVSLERSGLRVTKSGVKIDLGGIAKGYACDEMIRVLSRAGIRSAMVQAGGDLKVSGPPPGTKGWPIQLPHESAPRFLSHRAVSTSGDTEQFVELHGKRYSHIVDPRTGFGVTNRLMVSVIGGSGLWTDPVATAVCVMGDKTGREAFRRHGMEIIVRTSP